MCISHYYNVQVNTNHNFSPFDGVARMVYVGMYAPKKQFGCYEFRQKSQYSKGLKCFKVAWFLLKFTFFRAATLSKFSKLTCTFPPIFMYDCPQTFPKFQVLKKSRYGCRFFRYFVKVTMDKAFLFFSKLSYVSKYATPLPGWSWNGDDPNSCRSLERRINHVPLYSLHCLIFS